MAEIDEYSEAVKLVEAERIERVRKCSELITQALEAYECALVSTPIISRDGRIISDLAVVPRK